MYYTMYIRMFLVDWLVSCIAYFVAEPFRLLPAAVRGDMVLNQASRTIRARKSASVVTCDVGLPRAFARDIEKYGCDISPPQSAPCR